MIKIDSSNWKEFKIGDLFKLEKGKCSNSDILEEGHEVPYIGAKKDSNGIMKWTIRDSRLVQRGNAICFICQGAGSNGFNLYMDSETIQSTSNTLGYNKFLNKYNGLFIVTVLDLERPKWSFGRGRNPTLSEQLVKLPSDQNGNPDWQYMEDYTKGLWDKERDISELAQSLKQSNIKLEIVNWKEFRIGDLFEVKGSKTTSKEEINEEKEQKYNYVTTQNNNNGVESKSDFFTELGNCITIDSATIGAVFYQEKNFIASDHVEIIKNDKLNKFNSFFIISILKKEQFRYGYGRKWNQQNISNTIIKLPVDQNGNPDWQYMENYIKSLPFSRYL